MRHYDYLIIGQGLAGSLLAYQLLAQRKSVMLLDNQHLNSSSAVAAGLINPLAAKRFNFPPLGEEWLSSLSELYKQLEKHFNCSLLHLMPILRIFQDQPQQQYHQRRLADPRYQHLIGPFIDSSNINPLITAANGGFYQQYGGYLDIPLLLAKLQQWFAEQNAIQPLQFDYSQLIIRTNSIRYQDIHAKQVIFCEGYKGQDNPWFSWLPFAPAKGEILTVKTTQPMPDTIVNSKHWILPVSNAQFKIGATVEHGIANQQKTPAAATQIVHAARQLLKQPAAFEIIEHLAGVRPATEDREPFIGEHPEFEQLLIFNGFGAKGALTIPFYSKQLCAYLIKNQRLPDNANVRRFL